MVINLLVDGRQFSTSTAWGMMGVCSVMIRMGKKTVEGLSVALVVSVGRVDERGNLIICIVRGLIIPIGCCSDNGEEHDVYNTY